jgi:hypothetical protein
MQVVVRNNGKRHGLAVIHVLQETFGFRTSLAANFYRSSLAIRETAWEPVCMYTDSC